MIYTPGMSDKSLLVASLLLLLWQPAWPDEAAWRDRPVREYIDWLVDENVTIIYSSDLVTPGLLLSGEPDADDPLRVLRDSLESHGLALEPGPGGSYLIVRPDKEESRIEVEVRDAATNDLIRAATVMLDETVRGYTDAQGRLSIAGLQAGTVSVVVEADGYLRSEPLLATIGTTRLPLVPIRLEATQPELTEIIVTSSLYRLRYQPSGSHTFLDRELTTRLPDVGDDAVRSVQRLPGVANGGVSTRNHVRGGVANEQLFLFDGLRLYEPYHLKDFHSLATIVDQNAIAGIDFYSAGYQARYGDRMSGVIDIAMREPPADTVTELALSFFSASALSMGRYGGHDRGDWLVTGRRGNLDLLADAVDPEYGAPRYEDALLHLGWEISDRTYLSGNLLLSYDKISIAELDDTEQATARYRNRVAWMKAVTDWHATLSSKTILSATEIDNSRTGVGNTPAVLSGNVTDVREFRSLALRQDWQWQMSESWLVSYGFDIKRLDAEYDYASRLEIFSPFDQILNNQPLLVRDLQVSPSGAQYAGYVEARWRPLERIIVDGGVRWDQQTYTTADNDDQTSLRINLLYFPGERTELRFGAGRYYQAQEINELQVADGVATFFPAQRATHLVASVAHELRSGLNLRAEFYQKKYRSLMPRYENVFDPLVLIPELQIDRARIDADDALSKGAEVTLSGKSQGESVLWWLSYSWALIEDSVAEANVPRSWDQTDSFRAGVNWDWQKWSFSAAGTIHSGWPRTDMLLETVSNPDGSSELVASTTPRNSGRYPTFHTLDARASRRIDVARGDLTIFLEISNLLNQQNTCCTDYRLETNAGGNQTLLGNAGNWLPLIPSLGVIWQF
jgi:hypothetical protein